MNDMYSYSRAGLPAAKRLQVNQLVAYDDINNHLQHQTVTVNLDSTYTYNDEGQVTAMTYPSTIGVLNVVTPGPSYNYSYDSMNRLGGMTDSNNNTIVSGVSYDAANRLLGMAFSNVTENRNYNVLGQLTQIWAPNVGKHSVQLPNRHQQRQSQLDVQRRERRDGDLRLRFSESHGDGVGQRMGRNLHARSLRQSDHQASDQRIRPEPVGERQPGQQSDPGLWIRLRCQRERDSLAPTATPLAYDAENRVTGVGWSNNPPVVDYSYDAQNKRIFMWTAGTVDSFSNVYNYSVVFYSPSGQKLGTYLLAPQQPVFQPNGINTPYVTVSRVSSDQYFGGRRLAAMDQLGSAGTYYPWGEAKGTTNPQDTWSYATYWRDSATGLDYANNRYYSNAYGRFMTPDPYQASGGPGDPAELESLCIHARRSREPRRSAGLEDRLTCVGGGDDDDDDDDDEDDGGGCSGGSGFAPSPSPYCQGGGPPPHHRHPQRLRRVVQSRWPPQVRHETARTSCSSTTYSPLKNTLGQYSTVGRPGGGPQGWFFAVQIQPQIARRHQSDGLGSDADCADLWEAFPLWADRTRFPDRFRLLPTTQALASIFQPLVPWIG